MVFPHTTIEEIVQIHTGHTGYAVQSLRAIPIRDPGRNTNHTCPSEARMCHLNTIARRQPPTHSIHMHKYDEYTSHNRELENLWARISADYLRTTAQKTCLAIHPRCFQATSHEMDATSVYSPVHPATSSQSRCAAVLLSFAQPTHPATSALALLFESCKLRQSITNCLLQTTARRVLNVQQNNL